MARTSGRRPDANEEIQMRWLIPICGVVAGAGLLAVVGSRSAGAQSSVLVDVGHHDYLRYCASCHGADAKGDGALAGLLRAPPPDLTTLARRSGGIFESGKISAVIDGRFAVPAHGTGAMPVWGRVLGQPIGEAATAEEVSRGQIDALVSYLQSIQR
jgi:mono/diheme cytochrome c family protein